MEPTPDTILDLVAAEFRRSAEEIRGRRRIFQIVVARHTAFLLARVETELSYPAIGRALGGFDHSSVHYGVQQALARARRMPGYARRIARLREALNPEGGPLPLERAVR